MFVVVFLSLDKTDISSLTLGIHLPCFIMKIPGARTDSVSEVQCKHSNWFSQGKIKFLKWLLLKSFFFWCTHSRKDLQVQEEHSSIAIGRGVVFPGFSVLYSCSLWSLSQMEGWRSTSQRSNPNICLATVEAFSLRHNTGQLSAIPLQIISLFDPE